MSRTLNSFSHALLNRNKYVGVPFTVKNALIFCPLFMSCDCSLFVLCLRGHCPPSVLYCPPLSSVCPLNSHEHNSNANEQPAWTWTMNRPVPGTPSTAAPDGHPAKSPGQQSPKARDESYFAESRKGKKWTIFALCSAASPLKRITTVTSWRKSLPTWGSASTSRGCFRRRSTIFCMICYPIPICQWLVVTQYEQNHGWARGDGLELRRHASFAKSDTRIQLLRYWACWIWCRGTYRHKQGFQVMNLLDPIFRTANVRGLLWQPFVRFYPLPMPWGAVKMMIATSTRPRSKIWNNLRIKAPLVTLIASSSNKSSYVLLQ